MSMRKQVMQRSHRKSISEMGKEITKNNDETLDGTFTRETPGLPSSSCARTRSKRTRGNKTTQKENQEEENINKENNLPVAQSTLINDSKVIDSPSSNVEKVNKLLEMTDNNCTNIEQNNNQNEIKAVVKENVKMTTQEAVDQVLEYKYKYERLCGIVEQFKEQHFQLLKNYQNLQTANKELNGKLKDDLYTLEADKYSLQEELDRTKEKLAKYEKENEEAQNKTNLNTSKHELSIVSNPSEPLSRTRRKSMLNENVSSIVKDDTEKCAFYEDIILDQQDILDFYSLLCASSICKQTVETPGNEVCDDTTPIEMNYSCKIQWKNHPLDGFPFDFSLNYEKQQLEYIPTPSEQYQEHLPCNLKTRHTYNADEGCLFVKEIADSLLRKNDKD